jgi:hypothetical protein
VTRRQKMCSQGQSAMTLVTQAKKDPIGNLQRRTLVASAYLQVRGTIEQSPDYVFCSVGL